MAKIRSEQQNATTERTELTLIERLKRYLSGRYELRYDVVGNEIQYRPKGKKDAFEVLNDSDLFCELSEAGFRGFRETRDELLKSSFVKRFDPFTAYFEGLPEWDKSKPDYIGQLASFVNAKDPVWFLAMFRKMLVRVIACGIGKAPFNKQCFVLVGKQNDGKTSFLRYLCPKALDAYYTQNIDFSNKDGRIALGTNLFINLDELASLNRDDVNKAKAFFTESKIKLRRPYDKKDSIAPRRASFFGSTNDAEFLTDHTGNVRWLVFEVDSINHDNGGANGYQGVNIDDVWSQAYSLLKSGFPYELTKTELEFSEALNRRHMKQTAEMELIGLYIKPAAEDSEEAEFLNATELTVMLQSVCGNALRISHINVGKALTALHFKQVQKRVSGLDIPKRGYLVDVLLQRQKI